jgi:protein O-mannosyl-transferase
MKKEKKRTAERKIRPEVFSRTVAATPGPAAFRLQWWHYGVALLLSIFAALEVYGPALHGEFLFDDSYLPFLVPDVADLPLRSWLGVRPVLMFSYWLNYQSSGLNPYPYHVVNVLLHAVNALLIWIIVRRYLTWVSEKGEYNNLLAAFAGLLFLLHPVQAESVAYVTGRSETLSIFFFLSALAVYVHRKSDSIGWVRAAAVITLFGIACTVKEHAIALLALLALTDYYFTTRFRLEGMRRNWRLYAPILITGVVAAGFVMNHLRTAESAGFRLKEFTWYQYLFTQFRSIWLYLRLYVLPFAQNGDYQMSVSRTILEHGAIFGLVGLVALAVLAWRFRREYALASFGFFGFLLLLAPTSSIVPIRDVAAERRLYLPFVCLLLITVDFLRRWKYSKTALIGLMAAVSAGAAILTYQRSHVWSTALAFWQDNTAKSPHNSRAWFQLAYAQWQAGQCNEAVTNYERVSKMMAPRDDLMIDWAYALECAGRPDDAVAKLRQAAQATPTAHIFATIGMIQGKRGKAQESLDALAAAEKLNAKFDMLYVYRGNVLLTTGDRTGAINEYKRALAVNPRNQPAREALAAAQSRFAPQTR